MKTNYEKASAQMLASVRRALDKFSKSTDFVVTKIELAHDGILYEIQSKEYFAKRMERQRKRKGLLAEATEAKK